MWPSLRRLRSVRRGSMPDVKKFMMRFLQAAIRDAYLTENIPVQSRRTNDKLRGREQSGRTPTLKPKKWSTSEEVCLLQLSRTCKVPDSGSIAKKLGRTRNSVAGKIRGLTHKARVACDTNVPKGRISDAQRSILMERAVRILGGFTKMRKTEWYRVLQEKSNAEWAAEIIHHTPEPVQHILSLPSPPTAPDLRSLGWQDTKNFGVYICVLEPRLNPWRPEPFVHVGSATGYGRGLADCKADQQELRDPTIAALSNQYDLRRTTAHYATLFSKPVAPSNSKDVLAARHLTIVSEAVLTVWFAALSTRGKPDGTFDRLKLLSRDCWDYPRFPYRGTCSQPAWFEHPASS